jgi:hypothetical protein
MVFGTFRNPKARESRAAGFYAGASARLREMLAFRDVASAPPCQEDRGSAKQEAWAS